MMQFYYTLKPLYGLAAGRVERFAVTKAAAKVLNRDIEPYDPKNPRHTGAPGAPPAEDEATKKKR